MKTEKKFWLQWFLLILLTFGWPWSVGRVEKCLEESLYAEGGEAAMRRNALSLAWGISVFTGGC